MGNELSNRILNYEAHIHIPNNQTELRAWAHGPLNGNIELIGKDELKITVSNIFPNTAFDTRFVFDLNVVPGSMKTSNMNALSMILNIEEQKALEANQQREKMVQFQIETVKEKLEIVEQSLKESDLKNAK